MIRSYFQPDDHNNPTFLVLPDERIMIFYSRHTDEPCFYYRVSRIPGDITTLGEEKRIETKNNTTYPSPFILSDDPEHIYLCWRGIGWHPTIAKLSLPDDKDEVDDYFAHLSPDPTISEWMTVMDIQQKYCMAKCVRKRFSSPSGSLPSRR